MKTKSLKISSIIVAIAALAGFASNASAFDAEAEVNAKLPSGFAVVAVVSTNPTVRKTAASGVQLQAAIAAALADAGNSHTAADAAAFVSAILPLESVALRTAYAANIVTGAMNGISTLTPATADYVAIAHAAVTADFGTATAIVKQTTQNTILTTVMKGTYGTSNTMPTATPSFTVTNALVADVVNTVFAGTAGSDTNVNAQVQALAAMYIAFPVTTTGFFTTANKSTETLAFYASVTGAGALSAADAGKIAGRLTGGGNQGAVATLIAQGMASSLSGLANKQAFATAAASQYSTFTGTTPQTDLNKNNIAIGIANTAGSVSDQVDIAITVGATMNSGEVPTTTTVNLRRASVVQAVVLPVMKASIPSSVLVATPDFTVTQSIVAKVAGITGLSANASENEDGQTQILNAVLLAVPLSSTAPGTMFTASQRTAALLGIAGAVTGAGGLAADKAGVLVGRLSRTQSAIIATLAQGMAANLATLSAKETFATAAGSQYTTITGTTPLTDAVKNNIAIGIATTASTISDQVDIAVTVAATMNSGEVPTTTTVNLRRASVVQAVIIPVMKASLPTSVITTTPDFTVTQSIVAKVTQLTGLGADTSANTDAQVQVLNAVLLAVPVSSAVGGSHFTASQRTTALIAIGGMVTGAGGASNTLAGNIAGRLARTQSAIIDPLVNGMAANLSALSDKTAFATAAASQYTTITGTTPLTDVVKQSIATGISKTDSNGTHQGDIVAAIGATMLVGDPATTAAVPLDVRRANLAVSVIKLDYTKAPALVQELLAQLPLVDPSGFYNGSTTLTIAAKFATTLTAAIPQVSTLTGVTLTTRTNALTGEVVSINDQYANNATGISIKVAVAQAVITVNATLVQSIARAVADEAFNNVSGWTGTVYSGTVGEQKAQFIKALASGLGDANKGLIAGGAALADTSLAGLIALKVGDANIVAPVPTPTITSRANIAVAIAKAINGASLYTSSILQDIASTGASAFGASDPISQGSFASSMITSLTLSTSGFGSTDVVTPIAYSIANKISTDSNSSDGLLFVGKLANLQGVNTTRIGTIVTAVAPVFASQIPTLALTVATNAKLAVVQIATAAANYSPTDAVAIASNVAGVSGINVTLASGIFTATATAGAGTQGTLADKATQVSLVAQAILAYSTLQAQAGNLATAAGALSTSILDDTGRATVAGAMASSLTGLAAVISANAVLVADNLAKTVSTGIAKGNVAAAVINAQPATLKAVVQKVVAETGLTTPTLKAGVAKQVGIVIPSQAGAAAAAVATAVGVLAADAPTVANVIATGQSLTQQIAIAHAVAVVQSAQAANVGKTVMDTSLADLGAISDYLDKSAQYAAIGAKYATQFTTSVLTSTASADIAGEAAAQSALNVTAANLNEVAKVFGGIFASANTASTLAYSTSGKVATGVGTELQKTITTNAFVGTDPLTEEFAAIAIALTHSIPTSDMTNIKAVATALAKINNKAAPDILGVIISDLINRGVSGLTKTNATVVAALKAAVTITGMSATTLANLTAVINDIFDGAGGTVGSNPYGTYGTITGAETPVHNG